MYIVHCTIQYTEIKCMFNINLKLSYYNVDNGVDVETVTVNTSSFITMKDAFY